MNFSITFLIIGLAALAAGGWYLLGVLSRNADPELKPGLFWHPELSRYTASKPPNRDYGAEWKPGRVWTPEPCDKLPATPPPKPGSEP
jgi:hypothetical protein